MAKETEYEIINHLQNVGDFPRSTTKPLSSASAGPKMGNSKRSMWRYGMLDQLLVTYISVTTVWPCPPMASVPRVTRLIASKWLSAECIGGT